MDSDVRSIGTQTPTEKLSFTFPDVTSSGFTPPDKDLSSPTTMFNPVLDCAGEVGKLLRAIADDFARIRTRGIENSSSNSNPTDSIPWLVKQPRHHSCVRT